MPITPPRASGRSYRTVPLTWTNLLEHVRLMAEVVNGLMNGKINATGTVTLTANQATTTLADLRIGPDSVILFMATTANAAAEAGAGGMYVSSRGKQTAVITHANNAQTNRDFSYCVLG